MFRLAALGAALDESVEPSGTGVCARR